MSMSQALFQSQAMFMPRTHFSLRPMPMRQAPSMPQAPFQSQLQFHALCHALLQSQLQLQALFMPCSGHLNLSRWSPILHLATRPQTLHNILKLLAGKKILLIDKSPPHASVPSMQCAASGSTTVHLVQRCPILSAKGPVWLPMASMASNGFQRLPIDSGVSSAWLE